MTVENETTMVCDNDVTVTRVVEKEKDFKKNKVSRRGYRNRRVEDDGNSP